MITRRAYANIVGGVVTRRMRAMRVEESSSTSSEGVAPGNDAVTVPSKAEEDFRVTACNKFPC